MFSWCERSYPIRRPSVAEGTATRPDQAETMIPAPCSDGRKHRGAPPFSGTNTEGRKRLTGVAVWGPRDLGGGRRERQGWWLTTSADDMKRSWERVTQRVIDLRLRRSGLPLEDKVQKNTIGIWSWLCDQQAFSWFIPFGVEHRLYQNYL